MWQQAAPENGPRIMQLYRAAVSISFGTEPLGKNLCWVIPRSSLLPTDRTATLQSGPPGAGTAMPPIR